MVKFDTVKNLTEKAGEKVKVAAVDVSESTSAVAKKASEVGKKAAKSAQEGAKNLSEKVKDEQYQARMKKYNPLFPEEYNNESFNLPNIIMIVDDADRKNIDVCEGAIGWTGEEKGTEVLYIYDEFIDKSGLDFMPTPQCDSIYYVDRFDRKRFVDVDKMFDRAQEEKIAELQHIAFSLGAKSFEVEIAESSEEIESNQKSKTTKGSATTAYASSEITSESSFAEHHSATRRATGKISFTGSEKPVRPELKWFEKDNNILNLIEMRCSKLNDNKMNNLTVVLDGASSATLSRKTAVAIDNAVSQIGAKGSSSLDNEVQKENRSKFYMKIEF